MTRARIGEHRERLRRPIDTADPAALISWAYELWIYVADIRQLAEQATLPPRQRVYTRAHTRRHLIKAIRELEIRLAVVAPQTGLQPEGGAA